MKKAVLLIFLLVPVVICPSLYAESFFSSNNLSNLSVSQIDKENGFAYISGPSGVEETVIIGDRIGDSDHEVITIERAYIRVKSGNSITRMPVRNNRTNTGSGLVLSEPISE
jgi:hypothetical protein